MRFRAFLKHSYRRRVLVILCFLTIVFVLLHIHQTCSFLFEHFLENDNRNRLIQLDMNVWRGLTDGRSHTKIPRHIHQIWIASRDNADMYDRFQIAANSCIEHHSNYNYTLWTHRKIERWLTSYHSWFLPLYRSYRYDMQRIDAMKYLLLFHFGGLYLDLDVKCKVPDLISAMVPKDRRDNEPDIIFHMGTEGISANTDMMAAKRYHPFFKLAVHQLKAANRWFYFYHLTIILSAGPTFLYGIYRQFPFKDDFYFIPNNLLYEHMIEGVGGGTWYGKDSVLLIQLMENKLWSSFWLFVLISILFVIVRLFKKNHVGFCRPF